MEQAKRAVSTSNGTAGRVFALLATCFVAFFLELFLADPATGSFELVTITAARHTTIHAAVIILVFYLLLCRGRGFTLKIALAMMAIYLSVGMGTLLAQLRSPENGRAVVDAIKTLDGSKARAEKERLVLKAFTDDYLRRVAEERNAYAADLEASGWGNLLDAERLQKDPTLAKSQLLVANAKEIVARHQEASIALLEDMPARARALKVSEATRRDMLKGMQRKLPDTRAFLDHYWALQHSIVEQGGRVIDVLQARRKNWKIENQGLIFDTRENLALYREQYAEMQRLSGEIDKVVADASERERKGRAQLDEALKPK